MDYIRILGSSGTKTAEAGMTSVQISPSAVIDAGNIIEGMGDRIGDIEHIFLTHSHMDHIQDIPFILDLLYERQEKTLNVYGLPETIEIVETMIFNDKIFPDFSQIKLLRSNNNALTFHKIDMNFRCTIDSVEIKPFPTSHTVPSCGYIIKRGEYSIMFTSDTGPNREMWEILNRDKNITALITEVSFPNECEKLAMTSKHYTPSLLARDLNELKRDDMRIFLMHLKPLYRDRIVSELEELGITENGGVLSDGSVVGFQPKSPFGRIPTLTERFDKLLKTAIALSTEHDYDKLNKLVLDTAVSLTSSDGGTLYLYNEESKSLKFEVLKSISMNIELGGTKGKVDWPPISLYDSKGNENHSLVAAHCALSKKLINIEDVYKSDGIFDFKNTKEYDKRSGYRSKSMLVVPLTDHENNLIGVIQLLNKTNPFGKTIAFDKNDEKVLTALGSQAAVSINNQKLISDLETLFESFLDTINLALDEKSPYTAGHIGRMVEISMMLATAISKDERYFPDIHYNSDDLKTIKLAAMMHDIGKITTPMAIMDKATKLQTIFDRIELIKTRFELYACENECREYNINKSDINSCKTLEDDINFLEVSNKGGEYFDDSKIERIHKIATRKLQIGDKETNLLTPDEVKNLSIRKGTLTDEERDIINNHAAVSLKMLNSIKFPKKYSRVPEIAGSHHEKINGKGYPRGLKGDEISFEARILAVADIFEALTASDRPYKPSKKLSESMKILWFMAKDEDIDRRICRFFYESGLYREYAKKHLPPQNLDEVNLDFSFGENQFP